MVKTATVATVDIIVPENTTIDMIPESGYFIWGGNLWRKSGYLRGSCNAIRQRDGAPGVFSSQNDLQPVADVGIAVK